MVTPRLEPLVEDRIHNPVRFQFLPGSPNNRPLLAKEGESYYCSRCGGWYLFKPKRLPISYKAQTMETITGVYPCCHKCNHFGIKRVVIE